MLFRYKKSFEKIAMGLLSFMPNEKELKRLQNTIKLYEEDEDWQLYLYKEEEIIIGAIGVKIEGKVAKLHHVSINPSYRGQGRGKAMLTALINLLGNDIQVQPTGPTEEFFENCGGCCENENSEDPNSN